MRSFVRFIPLFLTFALMMACKSTAVEEEQADSVVEAQEKNEAGAIDESVSDFLTEAADARMMDLAQSRLAVKRGTTEDIRKYGQRMIQDQTRLLEGIQKLAKTKKVALPKTISDEKERWLAELQTKSGKEFDKKFMQMITIDHRRDVRKFRNAGSIEDKDVAAFASKHLPLIEGHLEQAKEIKTEL